MSAKETDRARRMALAVTMAAATLATDPAAGNDSVAHLAAGGLVLSRTDQIEMVSEDLFVSEAEIRVHYRFRNKSDAPVTTLVAFPMPELRAPSDVDNFVIPVENQANFLGFETMVDGRPAAVEIEQRAHALGIDRTDLLKSLGVPIEPQFGSVEGALSRLSPAEQERLRGLGLLGFEEYDVGQGMTRHPRPLWSLSTTYYWEQTFPAGATIAVDHRYTPSVGGSAQSFVGTDFADQPSTGDYRRRFCMDAAFERAARRAQGRTGSGTVLTESRLEYVLATGANWAGPIGQFRLTVDKGAPQNLVSFCGEGVRKVSPTRFETTRTDYWPEGNLEVLILKPAGTGQ